MLGFPQTGKTSLRNCLKNKENRFSLGGLKREGSKGKKKERKKASTIEVDKKVALGEFSTTIVDFGGQITDHHVTHLFTRGSRSVFLLFANPFEEGFEEQLRYWLRLLTHKSVKDEVCPSVLIVFSRRDDEESLSQEERTKEQKEKYLENLVQSLQDTFQDLVSISSWSWLDCTQQKSPEFKSLTKVLKETLEQESEKFKVVIPDLAIPDKIFKATSEVFYEREKLERVISQAIKKDEETASNWIDIFLKSHDFMSIKVNQGIKEFICTNIEKFGEEILSELVDPKEGDPPLIEATEQELKSTFLSTLDLDLYIPSHTP